MNTRGEDDEVGSQLVTGQPRHGCGMAVLPYRGGCNPFLPCPSWRYQPLYVSSGTKLIPLMPKIRSRTPFFCGLFDSCLCVVDPRPWHLPKYETHPWDIPNHGHHLHRYIVHLPNDLSDTNLITDWT